MGCWEFRRGSRAEGCSVPWYLLWASLLDGIRFVNLVTSFFSCQAQSRYWCPRPFWAISVIEIREIGHSLLKLLYRALSRFSQMPVPIALHTFKEMSLPSVIKFNLPFKFFLEIRRKAHKKSVTLLPCSNTLLCKEKG